MPLEEVYSAPKNSQKYIYHFTAGYSYSGNIY